jgi:metal-responsive CopG/Arc/MetJ family transcriptional regulator
MSTVQRHLEGRQKKQKTSITLSGELVEAIDALAGKAERSAFIERAVRSYLRRKIRRWQSEKDLKAINAHAGQTNRESDWLLEVQSWPD